VKLAAVAAPSLWEVRLGRPVAASNGQTEPAPRPQKQPEAAGPSPLVRVSELPQPKRDSTRRMRFPASSTRGPPAPARSRFAWSAPFARHSTAISTSPENVRDMPNTSATEAPWVALLTRYREEHGSGAATEIFLRLDPDLGRLASVSEWTRRRGSRVGLLVADRLRGGGTMTAASHARTPSSAATLARPGGSQISLDGHSRCDRSTPFRTAVTSVRGVSEDAPTVTPSCGSRRKLSRGPARGSGSAFAETCAVSFVFGVSGSC
jgi:hypothetical protein